LSLKIRWLHLLLSCQLMKIHRKNDVHTLPLAKIKWKTPRVCAKIRKECEKITKKSEFEA